MSQYDFGDLESPVSGTELINTHLEPFRDALHTSHAGSSRPSYVQAGMIWIDTTTNPWIVNCYDGSDDIPLGTINTTTNLFTPSNRALWAGSSGGTANALTLTPSPAVTTLAAGVVYDCLITSTNTAAAPTLNISGTGIKTIKCSIGSGKVNAPIGALQSGMMARIGYDGTDYILMNVRPYNPAIAIATASTVNLDAATGDYVQLTGTTTVTAITLSDGQERTCRAAGAFILTNGASLILPTGANITTAAGDVFVLRGEPSGVVRVVSYTRASGAPLVGSGGVLQTVESIDDTAASVSVGDAAAPTKIGPDVAITPQSSTSKIKISFSISADLNTSTTAIFTVYKDGSPMTAYIGETRGSRSRVTGFWSQGDNNRPQGFYVEVEDEPGNTSEHTYDVRVGTFSGSTIYVNRSGTDSNSASYFTGVSIARAEEIAQ